MANNPYVNKVVYGDDTLIDLTDDTITPSDVLKGVTFHDRSGTPQEGSLELASVATSGDFDDLSNRPTYTVSDETLIFGRSE